MNAKIAAEAQAEQDHGRSKHGSGPNDFEHDDNHTDSDWEWMIRNHNQLALVSLPQERRQHLIKIIGLATSAVESLDRKRTQ